MRTLPAITTLFFLGLMLVLLPTMEAHAQCTMFVCRSPADLDDLTALSEANLWNNYNAEKGRLMDRDRCRTFCIQDLKDTELRFGRYWIFRDKSGGEWYWE